MGSLTTGSRWLGPLSVISTDAGRFDSTGPARDQKDLIVFLRRASAKEFAWGKNDCLMWLADWIVERRGYDPAREFRGRYRTPLGAQRIIRQRGGVVAHLDACLSPFGAQRVQVPRRGDIAVVEAPEGPTGAIVIGSMVARLSQQGVRFASLPILAAWRV